MKTTNLSRLAVLAVALGSSLAAEAKPPPNVVIVYTDDQGWADLGIHGADPEVRTPRLDQLAREGALFKAGYSTAPQCVPARAGLIAGRHQNAFGVDDNRMGPLPHDEYTIAERLRDAGYVTGMVGKWHLDLVRNPDGRGQRQSADYLPHTQTLDLRRLTLRDATGAEHTVRFGP